MNENRSLDLPTERWSPERCLWGGSCATQRLRGGGDREGSWKVELRSKKAPQKDRIRKNKICVSVLVCRLIPVIPVLSG